MRDGIRNVCGPRTATPRLDNIENPRRPRPASSLARSARHFRTNGTVFPTGKSLANYHDSSTYGFRRFPSETSNHETIAPRSCGRHGSGHLDCPGLHAQPSPATRLERRITIEAIAPVVIESHETLSDTSKPGTIDMVILLAGMHDPPAAHGLLDLPVPDTDTFDPVNQWMREEEANLRQLARERWTELGGKPEDAAVAVEAVRRVSPREPARSASARPLCRGTTAPVWRRR